MPETVDDEELVKRFPWVKIDHDTKHMFRGWLEKQFLINRCNDCSSYHHPPKPVCPECWSSDITPTEVKGDGVVHLAMFLRQGPPAPDVDYAKGPHPVVAVELDGLDGVRFSSTVIDCPVEEVEIGLPVELAWVERYGSPFPVFRKRGSGAGGTA